MPINTRFKGKNIYYRAIQWINFNKHSITFKIILNKSFLLFCYKSFCHIIFFYQMFAIMLAELFLAEQTEKLQYLLSFRKGNIPKLIFI